MSNSDDSVPDEVTLFRAAVRGVRRCLEIAGEKTRWTDTLCNGFLPIIGMTVSILLGGIPIIFVVVVITLRLLTTIQYSNFLALLQLLHALRLESLRSCRS